MIAELEESSNVVHFRPEAVGWAEEAETEAGAEEAVAVEPSFADLCQELQQAYSCAWAVQQKWASHPEAPRGLAAQALARFKEAIWWSEHAAQQYTAKQHAATQQEDSE